MELEWLKRIRARLSYATKGPWILKDITYVSPDGDKGEHEWQIISRDGSIVVDSMYAWEDNAIFIAHSWEDINRLSEAVWELYWIAEALYERAIEPGGGLDENSPAGIEFRQKLDKWGKLLDPGKLDDEKIKASPTVRVHLNDGHRYSFACPKCRMGLYIDEIQSDEGQNKRRPIIWKMKCAFGHSWTFEWDLRDQFWPNLFVKKEAGL